MKFPRGNPDHRPPHEPLATTEWMTRRTIIGRYGYEKGGDYDNPFLFGKMTDDEGIEHALFYDDDAHIITIGGSRSGKGVSLILPNLLSYPGSAIVIDPKGENANITAKFRREKLGQEVIVLDPFNDTKLPTAALNPLLLLDPDHDDFIDDATDIAEALIVRSSDKDAYWDDQARSLIKAVLIFLMTTEGEEKTLTTLRKYLLNGKSIPDEETGELLTPSFDNLLWYFVEHEEPLHEFVTGTASSLLNASSKERGTILTTALRNTEFLDSEPIKSVLSHSDIDLAALRSKKGATIYLVLPEIRLESQSRWFRLLITTFIRYLQIDKKQTLGQPSVLFVMDEFSTAVGYLKVIERASGYIAGFGVRLWVVLQDLSQLKDLYPKRWETFIGNAGILTAFGNVDLTTLEYLSRRLGKCEAAREDRGFSGGSNTNKSTPDLGRALKTPLSFFDAGGSEGTNESWAIRPTTTITPLLHPDEIGRLFGKSGKKILLLTGQDNPIWADRILFYEDEPFKSHADKNPNSSGKDLTTKRGGGMPRNA